MTFPLRCKNHPNRPANKMCRECKLGLCKYCNATSLTDFRGEHLGYVCEDCKPINNQRGIKTKGGGNNG